METSSDTAWLQKYQSAADPASMGELIRRHAGMVFGVARRITGNAHDAEDVAQSCFLELIRNADGICQKRDEPEGGQSAAGWLHGTAMHRAMDLMRNQATRRRHETEAARTRLQADATAQWWEQIAPSVDQAINALPATLKEPIILHFLQGHIQQEVAALLGLSQPTVSRRLEQAVAEL